MYTMQQRLRTATIHSHQVQRLECARLSRFFYEIEIDLLVKSCVRVPCACFQKQQGRAAPRGGAAAGA